MRKHRLSLINKLFMQRKRWSLAILVVSVTSSLLNSVGLTLLVPVLFKSFDFNHSENITSKVFTLFDKYLGWLPGDNGPWVLLFILTLFVVKNALIALRVKLVFALSRRLILDLRQNLLQHIMGKDLHYFHKVGSGNILNQVNNNTEKASSLLIGSIELFGMIFQLLAYVGVLAYLSWKLCLIVFIFSAPLLGFTRFISKKARALSIEQSKSRSALAQNLSDLLHGIRFVKLSGREKDHIEWMKEINNDILVKSSRIGFMSGIGQPITELTALCLLLAMIVSLSFFQAQKQVSLDSFFSYLLILSRTMPLFTLISNRRVDVASNAGAVSELEAVLNDRTHQTHNNGNKVLNRIKKNIIVDNVSFAYPDSKKSVLNAISFEIKQGESIAIVGPSGSGKSTMIDLLLGFYRPTTGKILIDDTDYTEYNSKSYRSKIGIVPQEVILFFSTVRENLTYMNPNASEIEIWRALEQADMADFISQLPNGLDTEIGEKGVMLSGGQKQRLSIARALLQKPELLIFDEATSSLDSISETKIVDSIKQASAGRTTITIAHRLATILHCSRVILIEHGWMVEEGSIQQLMNKSSRFRKYAEAQNLKLSA